MQLSCELPQQKPLRAAPADSHTHHCEQQRPHAHRLNHNHHHSDPPLVVCQGAGSSRIPMQKQTVTSLAAFITSPHNAPLQMQCSANNQNAVPSLLRQATQLSCNMDCKRQTPPLPPNTHKHVINTLYVHDISHITSHITSHSSHLQAGSSAAHQQSCQRGCSQTSQQRPAAAHCCCCCAP